MTDDYKQKYEDLMKRCEEFNIWFEEHKRKMKRNLGPAKTEDIQWPRDKESWPPITTAPWPPGSFDPWNAVCETCRLSMTNKSNYVCNIPSCPRNFTRTCSLANTAGYATLADNNMSMLKPETPKTLTITQLNNLKKEEDK